MGPEDYQERDARIAKLTRLNYSSREIAVIEGITRRSVQRARRRSGSSLKTGGGAMTVEERALVEYLLADGASYYEVARTVNRCVSTIVKHYPGYNYSREQAAEVRLMFQQLDAIKVRR